MYLFNLMNFQIIDSAETFDNAKGVIAYTSDTNNCIIAFPDKNQGFIQVKNYNKQALTLIRAFELKTISNITLNDNGSLLITAFEDVITNHYYPI